MRISAGAGLSSRESPFILAIWILGGAGWFQLRLDYIVPLRDGKPALEVYLDVAIGLSVSLFLDLSFAKGSVFIALVINFQTLVSKKRGYTRFSMVLSIAGHLNILGIIDIYVSIVLAITYSSPGPMIGYGRLKVRIKICWCFTLKVDRAFEKRFSGNSDKQALNRRTHHQQVALTDGRERSDATAGLGRVPDQVLRQAGRMIV